MLEAAEQSLAPALRQLDELREKCAALEAGLDRRAQRMGGRAHVRERAVAGCAAGRGYVSGAGGGAGADGGS